MITQYSACLKDLERVRRESREALLEDFGHRGRGFVAVTGFYPLMCQLLQKEWISFRDAETPIHKLALTMVTLPRGYRF